MRSNAGPKPTVRYQQEKCVIYSDVTSIEGYQVKYIYKKYNVNIVLNLREKRGSRLKEQTLNAIHCRTEKAIWLITVGLRNIRWTGDTSFIDKEKGKISERNYGTEKGRHNWHPP